MVRLRTWLTVSVGVVVLAASVHAVPVSLRLATIAPTSSPWHKALLDMADTWSKTTSEHVKATIYPDGKLGDDSLVVKNMRVGQIQASLMMLSGLSEIDDAFNALGMPFYFDTMEETNAVVEKLAPLLEARMAAKKFHILAWSNGGWVQIFSKNQMKSLADVKKAKLFTSAGDERMRAWYIANGFHPVALPSTDIKTALTTGMIDATPMPPYPAMLTLVYRDAPNMLDVHIGPLLGALIITTDAWNKISPEDQAKVAEAAKAFEKRTSVEVPALERSSLDEMKKRALTISTLDKKASDEFHAEADKMIASMRGNMVPTDAFDQVKTARDAYRASKK